MHLILDIGNSHTKAAFFDGFQLIEYIQDDFELLVLRCAHHRPERAMICETGKDEKTLTFVQQQMPFLCYHPGLTHPIANAYATPATLGADRIAGAVAAAALFPDKPVLKLDFGSCNTIDFIDPRHGFMGGSISPGIQMRFRALHHFTQKLPEVSFASEENPILTGQDTNSSIRSGVLQGILVETDGFIDQYRALYPQLEVVGTGGNAQWFVSRLKNKIFVRPYLVMEGLNRILQENA